MPSYVTLLVFGCLLGALVVVEETRRQGFSPRDSLLVLIAAYLAGLAGAGAVPLVQGLGAWLTEGRFVLRSGFAAYGGMIGGVVGAVVVLRRLGHPVALFLDAATPAMPLGYFFARIGCFLAGCDYGVPSSWPGAVRFPKGSYAYLDHLHRGWLTEAAPSSLAVHPTQLYLSFAGLLLFFVVRAIPPRADGRRFFVFVVGYAVLRSLIELLRGDAGRGAIGPLSTSQFLSVVTVLLVAALRYGRGRGSDRDGARVRS